MSARDLPKRIVLFMVGATLLFLVALAGSVLSIRTGMDRRAAEESVRLVSNRIKAMQEVLSATAKDYTIWGDAYGNMLARNFVWIYDNFASSATSGELFDGLVLCRGTFPAPVSWHFAGGAQPGPTFLPKALMMQIEARVILHDPRGSQTENFMAMINGTPSFVTAALVKPRDPDRRAGLDPATLPTAIFTRSLTQADLDRIAAELALTGLQVVPEPLVGQQFFALSGITGEVALYLIWRPPAPGSQLVDTMVPVLVIVVLAFAGLALLGGRVIRANAHQLVRAETEATRVARQDSLTGLPNRLAFIEHLQGIEDEAVGTVAVLFMDINGFKRINDTLGHDAGDAVVREFAARMEDLADKSTFFARIGGDEFVFVVHDLLGVKDRVSALAQRFDARLNQPFAIAGHSIHLSLSQGLAIKQHPNHTTSELLRRADLAMYHAKRGGLGQMVTFGDELDLGTQLQSDIAQALRLALTRPAEFSMLYQPVFDPLTGAMQRVVALARWQSATLGPIDPGVFVPVAEATGQISALGNLLLDLTGQDLGPWPDLKISFRISPRQLQLPHFVTDLAARWVRHGITPDRVELSLPEPGIADLADRVTHQLDLFHEAGFTSSLDCFGTGFTAISALRQMPFQTLKLDHSLIGADPTADQSAELVRSLVHLGHALGKKVLCKGLNQPNQTAAILPLGCDAVQGNALAPPLTLTQLLAVYPQVKAQTYSAA
jgi:diguanylate cyclase (GGDEF)-like protein